MDWALQYTVEGFSASKNAVIETCRRADNSAAAVT